MTGMIGEAKVSSKLPFIIYSPSWGKLSEHYTKDHAVRALEAGVFIPAKEPHWIGYGQRIKTAGVYRLKQSTEKGKPNEWVLLTRYKDGL